MPTCNSRLAVVLIGVSLISAVVPCAAAADSDSEADFFERKVRPVLVQHCWSCHAKGQKKGGLSLESRAGLVAGGDRGAGLDGAEPARSLLLEAIQYDSDLQMPPNGRLPDHELAVLKAWVMSGAPWPESSSSSGGIRTTGDITAEDRQFWSFRPFAQQSLPAVSLVEWPRTRIDPFVAVRVQAEGLSPAPEADRRSLLRRAALDITGLLPSEDDLSEFLADDGPDAFSRAVDRLLASPHHGERWARHWLDLARYGEDQAHTFQARMYPQGYRYRDWVIESFNRDLPYDQFVFRQVSGEQPIADHAASRSGGADEARVAEMRRAQAPALGFFALGPVYYADAGCAPKAQADEWDDRIDTLARGFLGLTLACARCHDHKFDPLTMGDYYALAGVFASTRYEEIPLVPQDEVRAYDERVAKAKQAEEAHNAARNAAARGVSESLAPQLGRYLVAAWIAQNRRKAQADYSDAKVAEELGLDAAFVESWRKCLSRENGQRKPLAAYDALASAEDAQVDLSPGGAARQAVEGVAAQLQAAVVEALAERARREAEYQRLREQASDDQKDKLPKPQLDGPRQELLQAVLYDGKAPFHIAADKVAKRLDDAARQALESLAKAAESAKQAVGPKYPVAHGLADAEAKNVRIHLRGNHKTLGDEAPRRFLSILSPNPAAPFSQGSGRRELAQAIASPTNPLTARVFVNRVWQQYFGRGIVETPSNFGTLGAPPSHPELLDDLAANFVTEGWSTKRLARELLLSATYRQSSRHSPLGVERDPDNRWLWRATRRRLDIEAWRDAMLQATGQLNTAIGGPSQNLNDANHRRRTLYASISRHDLNSMLRLFDFPDPNLTSERRVVTTVPMQQLFALNSDFMTRQARALAAGFSSNQSSDDTQKVLDAYRLTLQREPTSEEREACVEFIRRAALDTSAKLSPWEQLAQALLASNEFLYVD